MSRDDWRYIIPRPFLDGLAATRALGRSTQVLVALLCHLYGDQANSGSETPEATVTLSSLVQSTGRSIREVQKAVEILLRAGVLIVVDASPGRARVLTLKPGPKEATPETGQGGQKGPGSGARSGQGPVPDRARVPTPDLGHTHKEQRKNLLKEPLEGTLDFAEVEVAHLNGHVEHVDDGRRERIKELLVEAIREYGRRTPGAEQRWVAYAHQLSEELARSILSERLIRLRARGFFTVPMWSNRGDSAQSAQLRAHMTRFTSSKQRAALLRGVGHKA